jgi:hypothetical protein
MQPFRLHYNQCEGTIMQKLTIAAVTIAFGALLASAPANAIENYGPSQVQGQCFKVAHAQGRDLYFGSWGSCPQAASVAVASTAQRRHARHQPASR